MPDRLSWSASRGLPEKVATMIGSDHSSTAELFWRSVSATVGAVRSFRATEWTVVAGALPAASAIAGIATSRTVHTSAPSAVPWRSRSTTNDADGADGPTLALPPLHTTAMPLVA